MPVRANDSYLKNVPNSDNFAEKVARFRQKGFHADPVNGNDLDTVAIYPILPPWGLGVPTWVRDATANDSDKTFTVPAGKVWEMRFIASELVCTATVGNRVLGCLINTPDGGDCVSVGTLVIAASQYGGLQLHFGAPVAKYTTAFARLSTPSVAVNVAATQGYGSMLFPAGTTIRIWDLSAIDAAADDLTVVLHYIEYDT